MTATIDPADLAKALRRPPPTVEQAAVILSPLEPSLVVAGAGSGKTETMAARVVYLVANSLVAPDRVLGLTFTRKAASELALRVRQRLHALGGTGLVSEELAAQLRSLDPVIGTYHSFAGTVIQEFGPLLGIEPPRRVLTATAAWHLARRVVGYWDGELDTDQSPERVTDAVLAMSGALADHIQRPEDLGRALDAIVHRLTAAPPGPRQRAVVHSGLVSTVQQLSDRRAMVPLVDAYERAKRSEGVVDFADQMQLAARLATSVPSVASALRDRHAVVLLDEYQDTGHAQRVILRALFGRGEGSVELGHPVTAVGDPVQSIYGWRGASASNLPRFIEDFPRRDGSRAMTLPLLTSFRNARRVLALANAVSAPIRDGAVRVGELRPAPDAPDGDLRVVLTATVADENEWVADAVAQAWRDAETPPSAAVLVRRRSSMAALAAALRAREIPVEIVGVGGLIDEPEVADIIATLRMVVDHQSGPAAMRILTGSRWRLGVADIAALARRARELQVGASGNASRRSGMATASTTEGDATARLRTAMTEALGAEDIDSAGLVDAIADPGDRAAYSTEGLRRIEALARELAWLRSRLTIPLPDLLAEIERTIGVDVEVLLGDHGRVHLDAFARVVADLAAAGSGPIELLDYLATAAEREDGLELGAVEPVPGRVQIMTIHAAKGLEWDVVALPHLSKGVFPSDRAGNWTGDPSRLPPAMRGDSDGLPDLNLPADADQSELVSVLKAHAEGFRSVHHAEERRLFYVALTRARHTLLLSAHHWGVTGIKSRGPSELLRELLEQSPTINPERWDDPPEDGAVNPLTAHTPTGTWPVDPWGDRRRAADLAAHWVRDAMATMVVPAVQPDATATSAPDPTDAGFLDADGWLRDAQRLLEERRSRRDAQGPADVELPTPLSVSTLVALADDPQRLTATLRRPVPQRPAPQARRGTAFHEWLEHHFGGDPLLGLDELPGALDRDAAPDDQLPTLIEAFQRSAWATRTPQQVEVPFVTHVAGVPIRGRIDAIFADDDGGATVVDWKTGAPPSGHRAAASAVQLAAYRLAWSRISGLPLAKVRAAFHYVAAGRTVSPTDLLDEQGLNDLIAQTTVG